MGYAELPCRFNNIPRRPHRDPTGPLQASFRVEPSCPRRGGQGSALQLAQPEKGPWVGGYLPTPPASRPPSGWGNQSFFLMGELRVHQLEELAFLLISFHYVSNCSHGDYSMNA